MELSREEAQRALGEAQDATERMRKTMTYGAAGPIITIWGVVWILGYVVAFLADRFTPHNRWFDPEHHWPIWVGWANVAWTILIIGGILTSWLIGRKSPVQSLQGKRLGFFWFLLFVFAELWMVMLRPTNPYAVGAFIATIPMFGYVVMGLWMTGAFMVWIGASVSGAIFLIFCLLAGSPWMWLWLAVFGGGSLTASGLYIWRKSR